METFYQLDRRGQSAIVSLDYALALAILQDDPAWGAGVMEMAGIAHWRAWLFRLENRWIPARVISQEQSHFTAFGAAGRSLGLTYQVEHNGEKAIRVTPAGTLDPRTKIMVAAALTWMGLLPLLLAPIVWKWISFQNRRVSSLYLDAFCRYLWQQVDQKKAESASTRNRSNGLAL